MENEIIVDKETLEGKVDSMLEFIDGIEPGDTYEYFNGSIIVRDSNKDVKASYECINIDDIKAQYPEVTIKTVKINGVTFVTADGYLIDCGIIESKTTITENTTGLEPLELGAVAVEIYDLLKDEGTIGVFTGMTNLFTTVVNYKSAVTEEGIDYDKIVDTGGSQLGYLKEDVVEIYTDMIMRQQMKEN